MIWASDDCAIFVFASKKRRMPAWCDRVLYAGAGVAAVPGSYAAVASLKRSDHRPVAFRARPSPVISCSPKANLLVGTAVRGLTIDSAYY
jgi:hypothetical protein